MKHNRRGPSPRVVLIAVIVVALVGVGGLLFWRHSEGAITSFEECAAAGNPIMESYPEQCVAGGKTFTNTKD